MQTTIPDDLPRRMRYYQSMIDVDSLISGCEYETLKESYVIFLCTKDPFGLNLPVYTFKTACKEAKDFALDDGVNKLFFNASAFATEKNLEIKGFLGYLCNGKLSDNFTENIDLRVERLKINEIFRSDYMMDALPQSFLLMKFLKSNKNHKRFFGNAIQLRGAFQQAQKRIAKQ